MPETNDLYHLEEAKAYAAEAGNPGAAECATAHALIDIAASLHEWLTGIGRALQEEQLRSRLLANELALARQELEDANDELDRLQHPDSLTGCSHTNIVATWTGISGNQIGICRCCATGFTRGTDTDTWEAAHA